MFTAGAFETITTNRPASPGRTHMNLKFSGRALAYLSHFKAESDIRYYLNGVYVAPQPPPSPPPSPATK